MLRFGLSPNQSSTSTLLSTDYSYMATAIHTASSLIVRISSGVVVVVIMLVLDKLVSVGFVVQIIVLPVLVLVLPVLVVHILVVVIHVSVRVVEILVVLQVLVVQILVVGVVEIQLVVLPVLVLQILIVDGVGVIIITAKLAYPWKVTICTACFIRYRVNMTFLIAFTFPTHAMGVAQIASVP